jgi:molybdopterin-binding protein
MEELLTPAEAARMAGVSYPTLKQWIYKGKLNSVKTVGGHHRVARSDIERISRGGRARKAQPKAIRIDAISGRNKLRGIITDIRYEGLLVQVTIDVGGQSIISIITSDATKALGLKRGSTVYALMKATEVMVIKD